MSKKILLYLIYCYMHVLCRIGYTLCQKTFKFQRSCAGSKQSPNYFLFSQTYFSCIRTELQVWNKTFQNFDFHFVPIQICLLQWNSCLLFLKCLRGDVVPMHHANIFVPFYQLKTLFTV